MPDEPPTLSVIVPVYGVENYIDSCLVSIVAAPGFADRCELILIDDGSPDNSMAIAERRCAGLANVTIVRQANAGLSVARNVGLAHAEGKYVWFVDSDDEICPNAIDIIARCIDRHDAEVIAFNFETIDGSRDRPPYIEVFDKCLDPVDFLVSGRPPSCVQFYVYSRRLIEDKNLRFEPGIYHEDALFTPTIMTSARSIVRLRESCYRYRIRDGSIMSIGNPEKHLRDMIVVARELSRRRDMFPKNSRRWGALAREIGFAIGAIRVYWGMSPLRVRNYVLDMRKLFNIVGGNWRYFSWRSWINLLRLAFSLTTPRIEKRT